MILFEDFKNENILNDLKYIKCIDLAKNNISSEQKFGAVLIKNGKIIGEGYNRAIAHNKWKINPFRYIKQGYANHAEIESINDALIKNFGENKELSLEKQIEFIKNSEIYVAGYFKTNKQLYFKEKFTCNLCPKTFLKFNIKNIYVPMPFGWIKRTLNETIEDSKDFKINKNGDLLKRRKDILFGEYFLKDLKR